MTNGVTADFRSLVVMDSSVLPTKEGGEIALLLYSVVISATNCFCLLKDKIISYPGADELRAP